MFAPLNNRKIRGINQALRMKTHADLRTCSIYNSLNVAPDADDGTIFKSVGPLECSARLKKVHTKEGARAVGVEEDSFTCTVSEK